MNNLVYINKDASIFPYFKNLEYYNITNSQFVNSEDTNQVKTVLTEKRQAREGIKKLINDKVVSAQIGIDDASLVANIMTVYLDQENRALLASLTKPLTISEIAKICKIPRSSAYRRTSFLLRNGYLRVCGYKKELGKKTKSAKFEKTIQNITIHISNNTNLVMLEIKKELFQKIGLR